MKRGQTGVTEPIPPTVTSMGSSFYLVWLIPREMSPVTWGFEKGKGLGRLNDNNPPHKSPPDQKVRLIANKDNQK